MTKLILTQDFSFFLRGLRDSLASSISTLAASRNEMPIDVKAPRDEYQSERLTVQPRSFNVRTIWSREYLIRSRLRVRFSSDLLYSNH
jgi:hypothetical protein